MRNNGRHSGYVPRHSGKREDGEINTLCSNLETCFPAEILNQTHAVNALFLKT